MTGKPGCGEIGTLTRHVSGDEDGDTVGYEFNLGNGRLVWCGELSKTSFSELADQQEALGNGSGWFIVLYDRDGQHLLGKAADEWAAQRLVSIIGPALSPPTDASGPGSNTESAPTQTVAAKPEQPRGDFARWRGAFRPMPEDETWDLDRTAAAPGPTALDVERTIEQRAWAVVHEYGSRWKNEYVRRHPNSKASQEDLRKQMAHYCVVAAFASARAELHAQLTEPSTLVAERRLIAQLIDGFDYDLDDYEPSYEGWSKTDDILAVVKRALAGKLAEPTMPKASDHHTAPGPTAGDVERARKVVTDWQEAVSPEGWLHTEFDELRKMIATALYDRAYAARAEFLAQIREPTLHRAVAQFVAENLGYDPKLNWRGTISDKDFPQLVEDICDALADKLTESKP